MCKVHNSVGCLATIKTHLKRHGINDFNSLNEVINFQKNFSTLRQQIISNHEQLIENEKTTLSAEILQLDDAIKTDKAQFENIFLEIEEMKQKLTSLSPSTGSNFIKRFFNFTISVLIKKKIQDLELNLNYKINHAVGELIGQHQYKTNRYNYITLHFSDAVKGKLFNQDKRA